MNFDFSDDQKVSDEPYDRDLWRGMVELAWPGTAIPERHGGAGFGYLELCVIAEELGRSLAPTPFASSVYLATEAILQAGTKDQQDTLLHAPGGRIAVGTDEILKNIIAERVLGLPQDVRADRDVPFDELPTSRR
jgi:alkylation response protein AidB-like acyl-CoA dehydrogenase